MAETKIPSIYRVPSKTDPELKRYLESVQEAIEVRLGRRGDELDQAVTFRDLIDSNLAAASKRLNRVIGPIIENPTPSMPFNTVPQNVQASGAFTKIMVTWDNHQMGSLFARAEIWRSGTNDLNAAEPQASVYGAVWTDTVDYNTTMYYWVRFVQKATEVGGDETFGAFSDPAASATTAIDIGATMTALSETLADLPGYAAINSALASAVEIIQASGVPDENTNRANGDDPKPGDIYINTATSQQYIRNAADNGWIEAADASLVTLTSAHASTISSHTSSIATANSNISTLTTTTGSHTTSINSLNTSVATKARVYRQDDAPGSGMVANDLWVDTNAENKLYQYDGSNWVVATDGGLATSTELNVVSSSATTAQNTANSKTKTFNQGQTTDGIPVSITIGDIWVDTDAYTTTLKGGTFATSTVTTGADTIALTTSQYNALSVGDRLVYDNGGGTTLTGLTDDEAYYVIKGSTPAIKLATSHANAIAGTAIDLTGTGNNAQSVTEKVTETNKIYIAQAVGADAITAGEWVARDNSAIQSATASVTQLSQTTADLAGNASASHVLQVNANGHVACISLYSGTTSSGQVSSNIIFQADRIFMTNSSGATPVAAFAVVGNDVFINSAYIQDAAITNVKIANATIESAKIVGLEAGKIETGFLNSSQRITIGSDSTGATDQRIEINAQYNRIVVVDDSS